MLKRFYTKKSGFTLVEIVVAFAIFAIMASMVAQILDLAIKARQSNNLYAKELARQQQLLTVVEKNINDLSGETLAKTGDYSFSVDGSSYSMEYEVRAADPGAQNRAEGINYFVSPVDYSNNDTSTSGSVDPADMASGAQMSRMDTRITGTVGFHEITVNKVVKDTFAYPAGDPYAVPAGHTRYFFEVSASTKDGLTTVMREEDVPYAQYRLYMYHADEFDAIKSAQEITDADTKQTYTEDYHKEAKIVNVGFINQTLKNATEKGLSDSYTSEGHEPNTWNPYTVAAVGNSVQISTPYGTFGAIRFDGSFTRFYVEFEGDPKLTTASFGHNAEVGDSADSYVYKVIPVYKPEYDTDGTPQYSEMEDGSVHPAIYGGFMRKRNYK